MNDITDIFKQSNKQSSASRAGGELGIWLLHLAKVAFLIYSATHTINASLLYAGTATPAKAAQVFGIVVVEAVLFALYLAYINQKITGSGQTIASGLTYAVGFTLACLGIIADSQVNAGSELSTFMVQYLTVGLPVSPAIMSLGAVVVHLLDPEQIRKRKQAQQTTALNAEMFTAELAETRLTEEGKLTEKALTVMGKQAVRDQLKAVYSSPEFAQAVQVAALKQAPDLFKQAGIDLSDTDIKLEEVLPKQLGDEVGK